jgi:hypothetical protein
MTPVQAAYQRFLDAENVWVQNLRAHYGKNYCNARYTVEAEAVAGYTEWAAARDEWHGLVKATWKYQ